MELKAVNAFRKRKYIFLTGLPRSGKTLISSILRGFFENNALHYNSTLEGYFALYKMGFLRRELLEYLSLYAINDHINEFVNKRRININSLEESSPIWKELEYKDLRQMRLSDSTHAVLIHSGLSVAKELESIFDPMLIINIYAHPTDIIFNWLDKGYGDLEFYQDNNMTLTCIFDKDKILPYYAKDFIEDFVNAAPIDRVVKMITLLARHDQKGLLQVNKNNVFMFGLDFLFTKADKYISSVIDAMIEFSGVKLDGKLDQSYLENAKHIAKNNFTERSCRERKIKSELSKEGRLQYAELLDIWAEWNGYG